MEAARLQRLARSSTPSPPALGSRLVPRTRQRLALLRRTRLLQEVRRPSPMFSLMYGFWKLLFSKTEFHVLIVGLDHAGKTSLLERLKAIFLGVDPLPPGKIPPTVGLNIGRMNIARQKLIFWDLGGSKALRSLWEKYYAEAQALLYVVDAADLERMDESREVLQQLLIHPDLAGIPVLVFANKQDAPGAVTPHEVQARFGLQTGGTQGGSSGPTHVLGVVSLSGEGVEEGIMWLVDVLRSHGPRALLPADSGVSWSAPVSPV